MTDLSIQLRASGGGSSSSSSSAFSESPDTAANNQMVELVELLGAGEWHGPYVAGHPLQGVYLDGTPVENSDGIANWTGDTTVAFAWGAPDQDPIANFRPPASITSVGVEVRADRSAVREITDTRVTAVVVTLSCRRLTTTSAENGSITGARVELALDVASAGGDFREVGRCIFDEKASSGLARDYRIVLTNTDGPWKIRARRITPDSNSSLIEDKIYWQSYTRLVEYQFTYPGCVVMASRFYAKDFSSIPTRQVLAYRRKVLVPANYDAWAHTYATTGDGTTNGVWDGTFKKSWSDNPVWCLVDADTDEIDGAGEFIKLSMLDKFALYEIARYCDDLVPDGFGGTERRFSCNAEIKERQDALTLLKQLAGIFNAATFAEGAGIGISADMPQDPVALFVNANVKNGAFKYEGTRKSTRHTCAYVTWNNPDNLYQPEPEYVPYKPAIDRWGIREAEVVALGCNSRGQAHRYGLWLLLTEWLRDQIVTFEPLLAANAVGVGQVFAVRDRSHAPNGERFGGLLAGVSTDLWTVTLDGPVTIDPSLGALLTVVLPDGTLHSVDIVNPGTEEPVTELTLTAALPVAPVAHAVWSLAVGDDTETLWTCLSCRETGTGQYEISALRYDPTLYELLDDIKLDPHGAVPMRSQKAAQRIAAPTAVTLSPSLIAGTTNYRVTVGWTKVAGALNYTLMWREANGTWASVPTTATSYDIASVGAGTALEIKVVARNVWGQEASTTASYTVASADLPASTVGTVSQVAAVLAGDRSAPQLAVTWSATGAAAYYIVETKYGSGAWTRVAEPTDKACLIPAALGAVSVRVAAFNGIQGEWATWTGNITQLIPLPANVSGLALTNGTSANTFATLDAAFAWDAQSDADHFRIEVWAAGAKIFADTSATPAYVYTYALNSTHVRAFELRVWAVNDGGESVEAATLAVSNPQCPAPTISVQAVAGAVLMTATNPGGDYAGTRMIVSPDPACPVTTAPYYDGPNLAQPTGELTVGTWYCRAAQYDAFGSDNLAWSTIVAIDVVANVSGTPSVIDASMITATTGSAPPGGDAYYAVYDLATKKLWTWHSELIPARYTSSVSAADITGTIQDAQLTSSLISRVALVDGADTMAGSVAQRVKAEADARESADNAQLARIASLESEVSDPTTGLTASANAIDQIETQINDGTNGLSALSTRTSVLEARGAGVNLLPNAAFEVDTASWALGWKQVAGDPDASFQRDLAAPDWLPPGMHTLGITRLGTPTGIQDFGCGTADLIPIEPGKRYCFSGWVASHRSACDLGINFRDANQNSLSETHSANNAGVGGGTDLNNWTRVSVFATAPANAVYAYVFLRQYPATDADPYSWLLRPMLELATSTQSQPSSWAPGAASTRALIASVQTALTAEDQANASSINQVSARLSAGGDTYQSIVSAQATATAAANKIAGKYAITIDANGHLTGWTLLDDGSTGSLTIAADKVNFSASSLIADIALQSPAWWGMGNAWPSMVQAVDGDGSSQPLRFFRLFQGGYQDFQGQKIQVNQGGQYRVRLRTYMSPDFAGKIFAGMDYPGVGRACPAPTSTDANWAGGSPFYSPATVSTGVWHTFDGIYTCSVTDWIQPRLTFEITAGYAEVQIEVVRATGTDLVVDGAITAAKIDAAYTNTTVLQAKQAVIDTLSASSVSSKFASLGDVQTGTITLNQDTIGSWAFIRSAGKFWNDGVNGFISAAHLPTTSFFQEFYAASGNALVVEQKASGGSVVGGGGVKYLLHVRSADNVDRIVIDPDAGQYIFRGTIYADAGTFSGTLDAATGTFAGSLSAVSGTFGTISAGYLQNADNSASLNLNAAGSTALLRAGGNTLIEAGGKTHFNNVIWSQVVTVNVHPCHQVLSGISEGVATYSGANGVWVDFDLGLAVDVSEFYNSAYSVHCTGQWSGSWPNDYTAWRLSVSGEIANVMPEPGASWTGCRLRGRLWIYLTDTSNNVIDPDATTNAYSVQINTIGVAVSRLT